MKLMVLDGNSIVNRAFYGIRMLTTSDGTPTNGVYGFLMILLKLLEEENPDAVCVAFDLPGPTFRHGQYEAYKAQRKGMPDELAVQIPILKEVLDAMNIPRCELAGYEADDIIGTLAEKCEKAGWECLVVTGDRDALQLVTGKTRVKHVRTHMGRTETTEYTPESFAAEYGFTPEKMVDLKALMGDQSDNIPGVPGVGEKTALELVRRFGGIREIYGNLDGLDVKDSVKKKLAEGKKLAEMSRALAVICRDAPLEAGPEDLKRREPDEARLYGLFRRLEFARLIERMGLKPPEEQPAGAGRAAPKRRWKAVRTAEDAAEMSRALEDSPWAAVRLDDSLGAAAVACGEGGPGFLLIKGTTPDFDGALSLVLGGDVRKAGHNVKDLMRRLMELGLPAEGWVFDAAVAAWLLSPTDGSYELYKLAERYAGLGGTEPGKAPDNFPECPAEAFPLVWEAEAVAALCAELSPKLAGLGMERLFYEVEMPLCAVLADMEKEGFLVDREALKRFGDMLSGKIAGLEREIYVLSGEEFNINSPKQLGAVLFEKLMLPAVKKTKTGYSTDVEVLEQLLGKHPIIRLLMDYRELTKLKSTYADGLLKVISADGRIHTSFQMTATATGRLSSTEPNLQNIPVRREIGGELRKMFIAGEGRVLVDADYSQIELRILAHISGDRAMQEAFKNGEDIHAVTASQVFGVPLGEVTPLQRSRAKAVNFGIVYGISPFSLSQDIGVTVQEAKSYIESYFAKYSGVREYMKNTVERAKADGFVTTLFGRRRYLPELRSSNRNTRAFGERAAMNTPIQGTAADIMKIAMVAAHRRIRQEGLRARLILQVHDELIAECPEEEAEAVKKLLKEEMERASQLDVPLIAEAHAGKSWFDAK